MARVSDQSSMAVRKPVYRFLSRFAAMTIVIPALVLFADHVFAEPKDFPGHSAYSKYEFGQKENVIDFATQPLAVPIGVISEVIKRDQVLKSALRKKGMEIRFHPFLKGPDINYFFRRGDIEAAIAGDMPVITLAATTDIIVAGLARQGVSSLVAKKAMLLGDLKGKRIGYPGGSTAHYGLLIALTYAGLKETDIRHVPMENSELSEALASGRIDAFSAFEPVPTASLSKHKGFVVIQKFLNASYFYLGRKFVERHPEEATQVVASFVRALRWMKADERNLIRAAVWTLEAGKGLKGSPPDWSVEQIAAIVRTDSLKLISDPFIPAGDLAQDGRMQMAFEFLKRHGKIPASTPWEKIRDSMDQAMMNEVVSNPGKYLLNRFDYRDIEG
jgi:ABC-type taurine transport system substrate-binding protein